MVGKLILKEKSVLREMVSKLTSLTTYNLVKIQKFDKHGSGMESDAFI